MSNEDGSGMYITSPQGYKVELTKEQASGVTFESEKTQLTVKGAAGSGKSLVLMGRALKFLNSEFSPGRRNGIIIFSHTNSLTSYAKEYLDPDDQKLEYLKVCTLDSYISEIISELKKKHFSDYPHGEKLSRDDRSQIVKDLLIKRGERSKHRFYKFDTIGNTFEKNVEFWIEEFEWMLGKGFGISDKDLYIKTERKGRGSSKKMTIDDRYEAFNLFRDYLVTVEKKNKFDWLQMHIFAEKNKDKIPERMKYDHVFVDEAQDLPIIDMHIAISLSKKDVLIAMDANQRIYKHHWTMSELGIPTTSRYLKKSFRCTKQIDAFAESLRKVNEKVLDDDDRCRHIVPEFDGPRPLVIEFKDSEHEKRMIVEIVKEYLKNKMMKVGLLLRTIKEIIQWSETFSAAQIPHEVIAGKSDLWRFQKTDYTEPVYSTRGPGLKLCTIHSAKGLEFHNVLIPSFTDGKYPPYYKDGVEYKTKEDIVELYRNLSYVAMTRAKYSLIVSFYNQPSVYLDEIFDGGDELFWHLDLKDGGDVDIDGVFKEVLNFDENTPPERNAIKTTGSSAATIQYAENEGSSEQDIYRLEEDKRHFEELCEKVRNEDYQYYLELGRCYESGIGVRQSRKDAIRCYHEGANNNVPECQYLYSMALSEGLYVKCDIQESNSWLERAAKNYYPLAQKTLARAYAEGVNCKKDLNLSFIWFKAAADSGDSEAQYIVSQIYRNGNEVINPDAGEYIRWLKVASYENADAQYELAICLLKGNYVENDDVEAYNLLTKASNAGNSKAQYQLSMCYKNEVGTNKNNELSLYWLKAAVASDEPYAIYELGVRYLNGDTGVVKDNEKARSLIERAANEFNLSVAKTKMDELLKLNERYLKANTIYSDGLYFLDSSPVMSDQQNYFEHFEEGCRLGEPIAEYNLALCYYSGVGCEKNEVVFKDHLIAAANKGCSDALYLLGVIYRDGIVLKKDEDCSVLYFSKAAKMKHPPSMFEMGCLFEDGNRSCNIPNNPNIAVSLYYDAAIIGYVKAMFNLAWCFEIGKGIPMNKSQAKYWYEKARSHGNTSTDRALERLSDISKDDTPISIESDYITYLESVISDKEKIFDIDHVLIDFLTERGYKYIDDRQNGGALWVLAERNQCRTFESIKRKEGLIFVWVQSGSKTTKNKPAWRYTGNKSEI